MTKTYTHMYTYTYKRWAQGSQGNFLSCICHSGVADLMYQQHLVRLVCNLVLVCPRPGERLFQFTSLRVMPPLAPSGPALHTVLFSSSPIVQAWCRFSLLRETGKQINPNEDETLKESWRLWHHDLERLIFSQRTFHKGKWPRSLTWANQHTFRQ